MSTPYNENITFEESAQSYLSNTQLRRNIGHATHTIRKKRATVVGEMPDWETLREAGRAIKSHMLRHLDHYLLQLEESVTRAGGQVHWARNGEEANQIVTSLVKQHGAKEVVKMKSITTDEINLNEALEKDGIKPIETDLAELIVQLAEDTPSHILVPAIHKNRAEIRELFRRTIGNKELTDQPAELADTARKYLRQKFLSAKIGISGANFAVAETGTVSVVESEGNGRMCITLPEVLISIMGIEKILPTWRDFEVFMQILPRSSTAERMNPYNSFWTGVTEGDGPQEFHLILMDNGRTNVLADEIGRQTLQCIRCSACLNVCPVYERTGGHAYHSVYPGPIGAILTPQLKGIDKKGPASLPYASSLCGACYEVCPVKINIPEVLVHLRGKIVRKKEQEGTFREKMDPEHRALKFLAKSFSSRKKYERVQRYAQRGQMFFVKNGTITHLPGKLSGWTAMRDMKAIPKESFRDWWRNR
ncbi:MAG TPA: LutB/LldF family L-lactate oxidation iron-sulfur protein [Balneolales bacterium]|nr:LutB/LldF family L-lactate oxidation iron-sulfur protein [Balneolales bacterium]